MSLVLLKQGSLSDVFFQVKSFQYSLHQASKRVGYMLSKITNWKATCPQDMGLVARKQI